MHGPDDSSRSRRAHRTAQQRMFVRACLGRTRPYIHAYIHTYICTFAFCSHFQFSPICFLMFFHAVNVTIHVFLSNFSSLSRRAFICASCLFSCCFNCACNALTLSIRYGTSSVYANESGRSESSLITTSGITDCTSSAIKPVHTRLCSDVSYMV